jgi:hypothetical protein
MPDSSLSDHDQRLKVLLKEFFEQFFQCFFPEWAKRFDFTEIIWLDKEVFLAPPQGEKRRLDLVARLNVRPGVPLPRQDLTDVVALVHIEVESRDSVQQLRPRMFEYYTQLRRDSGLLVLPIGLFLRVGLEGIGWDSYEEYFWEHRVLRFDYAYVGLPALQAEDYASGQHLLGVALSALMQTPPERRVELFAESLKRIAVSGENDFRQFLLTECLETYAKLDETQRQQFNALLDSEPFREAKPLMITTYERGKIEGEIKAFRKMALLQLETRFGPLPPSVQHRVSEMDIEQLSKLLVNIVKVTTIEELHLED